MQRLILDNGGGATLQLNGWAHHYSDMDHVAEDLKAWIAKQSTHGWDGHEPEALECEPTHDDIRNGGYRVLDIDGLTVADVIKEISACGWGNAQDVARYLSR